MSLAVKIEKLESNTSTTRQHNEWYAGIEMIIRFFNQGHIARAIKAAEEMDIVLDEFDDILKDEDDVEPSQLESRRLKVFCSQINLLVFYEYYHYNRRSLTFYSRILSCQQMYQKCLL